MLVERTAVARLPTKWGTFTAYSYTSKLDGIEHIAMVKVTLFDASFVIQGGKVRVFMYPSRI